MLDNYSVQIQKALKGIKIGDRIFIIKGKQTYEGLLMPRTEMGDKDSIVLKLDSGYNIGIRYGKRNKNQKIRKKRTKRD